MPLDLIATDKDLAPLFALGFHPYTTNRKVRITRLDPKSVEKDFPDCDRVVLVTPTGRTCTNISIDYHPQPTNSVTLRKIHTDDTPHTRIGITIPYQDRAINVGYDICSDKKDINISQSTLRKRGMVLEGNAFAPPRKT